ncbi:MAG: hypothetical protein KAU48_09500, partial [Candidatus Thorarchaeota archaeon]|nr:hypothetical protein [Candidatus Thorarchaeota archaeon]
KSTTFEESYLMLFPEDYNEAVLLAPGDIVPEAEPYRQLKCKKCKTVNKPGEEECFYCHAVLDPHDTDFGETVKAYELQEENEQLRRDIDQLSIEQMKMIEDKLEELDRKFDRRIEEMKKKMGVD